MKERKHVEYDPGEIVVANGAKQAVYEALMALCGPGDDVILPAPYWVSYPSMVDMCGATYTTVSTSIDDGFALTPEQLSDALKPNTKAILCNPRTHGLSGGRGAAAPSESPRRPRARREKSGSSPRIASS